MDSDYQSAIQHCLQGVEISMDPFYTIVVKLALGPAYVLNGQLQEAEDTLQEVLSFSREFAGEKMELVVLSALSLISFLKGETQALTTAEELDHELLAKDINSMYIWQSSNLCAEFIAPGRSDPRC